MTDLDPDDLDALAAKLTSFLQGLSAPERAVLATVLAQAGAEGASPEVEGFGLASNATQARIYAQEQAINKAGIGVDSGISSRRRASMDNMHKFLDIMRSMNPQI